MATTSFFGLQTWLQLTKAETILCHKNDTTQSDIYQPLDVSRSEIRLLEIVTLEPDRPVRCRLHTVQLAKAPQFTALSYVWGDPSVTREIVVNGYTKAVTTNLEAALRRVRDHWQQQYLGRPLSDFWIWVDAVCINQGDLTERSSQVQNVMRAIYEQAELVFCWLGADDPEAELGLRTVRSIHDAMFYSYFGSTRFWPTFLYKGYLQRTTLDEQSQNPAIAPCLIATHTFAKFVRHLANFEWIRYHPELGGNEADDAEVIRSWQSVLYLTSLGYWTRVWVFQELVLASSALVISGREAIPYQMMALLARILDRLSTEVSSLSKEIPPFVCDLVWVLIANGQTRPWVPILQVTDSKVGRLDPEDPSRIYRAWMAQMVVLVFEALDPRDYVYGLRSVTGIDIPVDYTISTADLFRLLTKSLMFLVWGGIGFVDPPTGWSSWAPQYSNDAAGWLSRTSDTNEPYPLYLTSPIPLMFSEDRTILTVSGCKIDEVSCMQNDDTSWGIGPGHFNLVQTYARTEMSYISGIPMLQALLRVMFRYEKSKIDLSSTQVMMEFLKQILHQEIGDDASEEDFGWKMKTLGDYKGLVEFFIRDLLPWCEHNKSIASLENNDRSGMDRNKVEDFIQHSDSVRLAMPLMDMHFELEHNVLFKTKSELLGLAPSKALLGDVLCVLHGYDMPVLLRPAGDNFLFVGRCWVEGLMRGEANESLSEGIIRVQEFNLI